MAKTVHVKPKSAWKKVDIDANMFSKKDLDGLVSLEELTDYEFIKTIDKTEGKKKNTNASSQSNNDDKTDLSKLEKKKKKQRNKKKKESNKTEQSSTDNAINKTEQLLTADALANPKTDLSKLETKKKKQGKKKKKETKKSEKSIKSDSDAIDKNTETKLKKNLKTRSLRKIQKVLFLKTSLKKLKI